MTTSSTIIADNPEMNCRLAGLQNRSPTKVILDRYLKVTNDFKIYNSSSNESRCELHYKISIRNGKLF